MQHRRRTHGQQNNVAAQTEEIVAPRATTADRFFSAHASACVCARARCNTRKREHTLRVSMRLRINSLCAFAPNFFASIDATTHGMQLFVENSNDAKATQFSCLSRLYVGIVCRSAADALFVAL